MSNRIYFLLICIVLASCTSSPTKPQIDVPKASWEEIVSASKGTTVNFMMWQGSPNINKYIHDFIKPEVKKLYDINLQVTGGQGPEIVQLLMGEKQASSSKGQIDMCWINGETFFQLRQIDGLYGPFVQQLPNAKLIDFTDPYISIDFQQEVNYMECPWSVTQFAMVHDSARIPNPPRNLQELESYVKANPGTFTISNDFSGMTLLKSFLAEIGGSPNSLNGAFEEQKYLELSEKLWDYINRNKQYFWKKGSTFPKEQTKMDQMFANGEIHLGFGFGEGSIDDKIRQGLFPKTTRAYPWDNGTIKNTNYLGITFNSPNVAGAMVVINHLISEEAQLRKTDPTEMDANTVLDIRKLEEPWKSKFENREKRKYGITMEELDSKAIQEPDPRYMIRLFEDFRSKVIEL